MNHLRSRRSLFVVLLTGAFVALGFLAPHARVQAQALGRLVVVPHSVHELTEAEQRTADSLESGLTARRIRIVSMHEARDRAQAQSRPPASPDNSDLDVLAREAHAALEHVAFGRSAAAQRSVQEVLSRAERALENLNRETKTARHVLDACLALVRNALARDERRDALAEAMRCRRLVPDVSPSEMLHPASVIGVLAEADDQLRRMRIGRLTVESKPDSGCATYVNGRHLGVTPFRLDRAAAGEYRVQVECGRAQGRVHIVQLGDDAVDLLVDAEYDRALRSGSRLALIYESDKDRKRLVDAHGGQLAKSVRADEAILVSVDGGDAYLTRVSASDGRVLGRARFAWLSAEGNESPALEAALDALFEGRMDPASTAPAAVAATGTVSEGDVATAEQPAGVEEHVQAELSVGPSPHAQKADDPKARTRKLRIVSGVLAGVGVGLMAVGIAEEMKRERIDVDISDEASAPGKDQAKLEKLNDDYSKAADLRWIGVAGGALMSAAVPLMRIDVKNGVPWWSYAIGAGGVGLAAWGAVDLTKNGQCELYLDDGCIKHHDTLGRGALALAAAAPLLTFPIAHLLEWGLTKNESNTQAYVAPTSTSIQLVVRKEIRTW
ncbi:MAG: PEGA domain-containing protein [Myxococcales bacterium]